MKIISPNHAAADGEGLLVSDQPITSRGHTVAGDGFDLASKRGAAQCFEQSVAP
jgi:hypothetical protein